MTSIPNLDTSANNSLEPSSQQQPSEEAHGSTTALEIAEASASQPSESQPAPVNDSQEELGSNPLDHALSRTFSSQISQALDKLQDYATFDDTIFQSAMTRLVDSPEPPVTQSIYKFVNIEFAEIETGTGVEIATILSRSASVKSLNDPEGVDLIRPESPTQEVEEPVQEKISETEEKAIAEPVEVEVDKVVINRQELIAKIKANLGLKDRQKAKNQLLQSKLVEYFRKKRVCYYMYL